MQNRLSIVIPMFNEAERIEKVLDRVWAASRSTGWGHEIILVDDGSSDDGVARARRWMERIPAAQRDAVILLLQPENQGKWSAVRRGYRQASGDVILVQDADLELDPAQYPQLLEPFSDPRVHVVYGVRSLPTEAYPWAFRMANHVLNGLTSCLFLTKVGDMETAYKALRREVAASMELEACHFEGEPEVTAKILRQGYRIREVPVSYLPRNRQEGKKVRFRDGFQAVVELLRWRLVPKAWWVLR